MELGESLRQGDLNQMKMVKDYQLEAGLLLPKHGTIRMIFRGSSRSLCEVPLYTLVCFDGCHSVLCMAIALQARIFPVASWVH